MLCFLPSYFCLVADFLDLTSEKGIEKLWTTFTILNFNTFFIKHYNFSIHKWYCWVLGFFSNIISNMSSIKLYSYNSKKIKNGKDLSTCWLFAQFRENLKNIRKCLRHLGVNCTPFLLPIFFPSWVHWFDFIP